MKQKIFTIN